MPVTFWFLASGVKKQFLIQIFIFECFFDSGTRLFQKEEKRLKCLAFFEWFILEITIGPTEARDWVEAFICSKINRRLGDYVVVLLMVFKGWVCRGTSKLVCKGQQCCGSAARWCESASYLLLGCGSRSYLSIWCGYGSYHSIFPRFAAFNAQKWPFKASTFSLWCESGSSFPLWWGSGSFQK